MRRALRLLGCAGAVMVALLTLCAGTPIAGLLGARTAAAWRETADAATTAPAGDFVPAGDVTLFVQRRGPLEGPVVVFVHGSGAWSGTWVDAMDAVAAAGGHAVAVDLPPFGYSTRPADGSYARPQQAARIAAALRAMGVQRYVLVGHSFGGGPTVELALADAERIDALVLVAAALGVDQPPAPLGPLAWSPLREAVVASTLTNPLLTPVGLRHFAHAPEPITPAIVARYQRPLDVQGATRAAAAWLPELLAPTPSPSLQPHTYTQLPMRTWLVWGAEDHATPVSQAEALLGWMPQAELRVLDGVGHLPQIEAPDALHGVLREALEQAR